MELRELAEQVLYGDTLELKLAQPRAVRDDHPGRATRAPAQPARPAALRFASKRRRLDLPDGRQLEKESARARLLHYFANHELLATELMALVLLKFPDAPKAFRHDVYQTLLDEQRHTRMYVERLRRLGLEFGAFPVNGHIWSLIAPMATPLDYVSRLSLTFEQANLDYSAHYASLFAQVGDQASSRLLDRIHRDEIGHVGCGLRWFRSWKDPALDDWDAFQQALVFPLSPSRAKGAGFQTEARRAAGLEDSFIERLFVYAKSKGRTPGIYVFHPQAESEIGHGAGFQGRGPLASLAADLDTLPQYLAGHDDVVLVREAPRTEFLAELKSAGLPVPQFEPLKGGRLTRSSELLERKIGPLRPWAWCPAVLELLQPLRARQTRPTAPALWTDAMRRLYSKATAAEWLVQFLRECSGKDEEWICPAPHVGRVATGADETRRLVDALRAEGHFKLVIKAPFGLAGRDMIRLWEPGVSEAQWTWVRRTLQRQGAVVVEPWLDRVLDFSVQWEATADRLTPVGWVRMENDLRGQYVASEFTPRFTQGFTPELARFVHDGPRRRLRRAVEDLRLFLESRVRAAGLTGPIGADMMIYRDGSGMWRWKPLVEINPRYTMGRVLLELMKHARHGRTGRLTLHGLRRVQAQGHADFPSFAESLRQRSPWVRESGGRRSIQSGAICLNDPRTAKQVLAVWEVGREPARAGS